MAAIDAAISVAPDVVVEDAVIVAARVTPVLAVVPFAIMTHWMPMVEAKLVVVADVTVTVAQVEAAVCEAQAIAGVPVEVSSTVDVAEGVIVNRHPV